MGSGKGIEKVSHTFNSDCSSRYLDVESKDITKDIKNEVMFFGAEPSFVERHRKEAPLTSYILDDAVEELCGSCHSIERRHVIVDTRVHMLMPGWYPCIPGWHHDDVARTRSDGQPNYEEQPYYSRHVLFVLNADVAPTEFAIGAYTLPSVPLGGKVYQTWDPLVEEQIHHGILARHQVRNSHLYSFDWQTMHRGVPAVKSGWRYFFRASLRTPRHRNEIRRQVQVYVPGDINQGW